MTGRPSIKSPEIEDEILIRLSQGEGLVKICRDKHTPSLQTVYNWLRDDKTFFERYARARDEQADTLADEIISIADETDDPNKARIQVDARKWVAAKLKPQKYSEKHIVDHKGTLTIQTVNYAPQEPQPDVPDEAA